MAAAQDLVAAAAEAVNSMHLDIPTWERGDPLVLAPENVQRQRRRSAQGVVPSPVTLAPVNQPRRASNTSTGDGSGGNSEESLESLGQRKELSERRDMRLWAEKVLQKGFVALKHGRKGKPHKRNFSLDERGRLVWRNEKETTMKHIDLRKVRDLYFGQLTKVFARNRNVQREHLSFSLIYGSKSLDLEFVSEDLFRRVSLALKVLCGVADEQQDPVLMFAKAQWAARDENLENVLPVDAVYELARKFNSRLSEQEFFTILQALSIKSAQPIMYTDFVRIVREIHRAEFVDELFLTYSQMAQQGTKAKGCSLRDLVRSGAPILLNPQEMLQFLRVEQRERDWSMPAVARLLDQIEPGASKRGLSLAGFSSYLLNPHYNSAFDPRKERVYQDMSHPISSYFISSSHNTYLQGSQVAGTASAQQYADVLLTGCRCIEIDCHDGRGGPIVTHKLFTGKISFRAALEAIRKSAFIVSSYPVILSLDIHCNAANQRQMARELTEVFGSCDMLPTRADLVAARTGRLASPAQLQRRVLLKGRGHDHNEDDHETDLATPTGPPPGHPRDVQISVSSPLSRRHSFGDRTPRQGGSKENGDDSSLGDMGGKRMLRRAASAEQSVMRAMMSDGENSGSVSSGADFPTLSAVGRSTSDASASGTADSKRRSLLKSISFTGLGRVKRSTSDVGMGSGSKSRVVDELYEMLYFTTTKIDGVIRDFEPQVVQATLRPTDMGSISDRTLAKYVGRAKIAGDFVHFNKLRITRVYPNAARFKSTNFDAQVAWNAGCHMAALNFQTADLSMWLNSGKFSDNGGSGYVLKPAPLRDPSIPYSPFSTVSKFPDCTSGTLRVRIVSGHQLPGGADGLETPSPYVNIRMVGLDVDTTDDWQTSTVTEHGSNPVWNEEMEFSVVCGEQAILLLTVWDAAHKVDGTPSLIGQFACPALCIREGYRRFPLRDVQGYDLYCAGVVCFVEWKESDGADDEDMSEIDDDASSFTSANELDIADRIGDLEERVEREVSQMDADKISLHLSDDDEDPVAAITGGKDFDDDDDDAISVGSNASDASAVSSASADAAKQHSIPRTRAKRALSDTATRSMGDILDAQRKQLDRMVLKLQRKEAEIEKMRNGIKRREKECELIRKQIEISQRTLHLRLGTDIAPDMLATESAPPSGEASLERKGSSESLGSASTAESEASVDSEASDASEASVRSTQSAPSSTTASNVSRKSLTRTVSGMIRAPPDMRNVKPAKRKKVRVKKKKARSPDNEKSSGKKLASASLSFTVTMLRKLREKRGETRPAAERASPPPPEST